MRRAFFPLVIITIVLASELHFVSLPHSVKLTSAQADRRLTTSELNDLNNLLLGLSTKPVNGIEVEADLFLRPRAIVIITVNGVRSLNITNPDMIYKLDYDGIDHSFWNIELASVFGPDHEFVSVTREGINGSTIANATIHQANYKFNTNLKMLGEELQHIHNLLDSISTHGAKFSDSKGPVVYLVSITGLASHGLSDLERDVAISDIVGVINKFPEVLSATYDGRVIFEVANVFDLNWPHPSEEQFLKRRKRDTDASPTDSNLKLWREKLNVYVFVGTDYPAIFAIFAGLTIALVLAVLYAVVAMMSMDPSKDSIIYRMTTTRMKKA
ncbi:renin receptor-like protein [Dictyocaulus viviparus]|uniref:Renin receptor-like protein n=1 Tax=Dictyocaulus viviparus TaxID=29172 RepID=A0A0D8Y559_DICVI|nr:renin receptor-like protein [Dictyocaulus viviparus]